MGPNALPAHAGARLRTLVVVCAGLLFAPAVLRSAASLGGAEPVDARAAAGVALDRRALVADPAAAAAEPAFAEPDPPALAAGPDPPAAPAPPADRAPAPPPPPPALPAGPAAGGAPPPVALFSYDRVTPHPPAGLEMEAAEEYATNNYGNLLWKHGAPRLLPPETQLLYYEPGAGAVSAMAPRPAAFLMPTANIFYNASLVEGEPMYAGLLPEARAATRGLTANVRNVDVPLLVIGSGRCSLDKRRLVESAI